MYKLGLIGRSLEHSFSKKYFDKKFAEEKNNLFTYHLFNLQDLTRLQNIDDSTLIGFNVTSPYKKKIIHHLDELDILAEKTQSVNTVFVNPKNKKTTGYNTDIFGFEKLLNHLSLKQDIKALILGSGGVSNTVSYVLNKKNIKYRIVSRQQKKNMLIYENLVDYFDDFKLIINTTPLVQYPHLNNYPNIPYHLISDTHQCIDLIYNPAKTIFLKKVEKKGAKIFNGYEMLITQAEESFLIWKKCLKKIGCIN